MKIIATKTIQDKLIKKGDVYNVVFETEKAFKFVNGRGIEQWIPKCYTEEVVETFRVNSEVNHPTFGKGFVMEDNGISLDIMFLTVGLKKLNKEFFLNLISK